MRREEIQYQPYAPEAAMKLLTRREAAELLRVKPQTLASWAVTGRYELPYIKIGGKVLYELASLEAFAAARTICNTGEAAKLND